MSLRTVWSAFFAAILLSGTIIFAIWLYAHWSDTRVIGYLVAWLPFLFSLIFALTPGKYMRRRIGVVFRILIASGGLLYSLILWHDRGLEDAAAKASQINVVNDAVSGANTHTDQQIAGLKKDVGDIGDKFAELQNNLKQGFSGLKPPSPKLVALKFKFFDQAGNSISMHAGENGTFSLDFIATNVTDVSSSSIDMWVDVCGGCTFAKEPVGFDKPNGTADFERHKLFPGVLNPGTSLEKMTIEVKPPVSNVFSFEIAWKYSCAACGKLPDPQKFTVLVLQPYKINEPKLKLN